MMEVETKEMTERMETMARERERERGRRNDGDEVEERRIERERERRREVEEVKERRKEGRTGWGEADKERLSRHQAAARFVYWFSGVCTEYSGRYRFYVYYSGLQRTVSTHQSCS